MPNLITIRWCNASLSWSRLLLIGTVVGDCVLVVVPASDAALLVPCTRAVLPLRVAPTAMTFVFALSVVNWSRIFAFARRFDAAVRASDVSRWVAGSAAARTLYGEKLLPTVTIYGSSETYLRPRPDDPAERVHARMFALADLSRLFVFRHLQERAIFRVDCGSVFDGMRILSGSRVKPHANRLFNSHASSAWHRALWNCKMNLK